MQENVYLRIQENPRFKELVAKRSRFAACMTMIILAAYFAFILLIAFDPQWLGTPLSEGSVLTLGMPVGVGIILLSIISTGVYVMRANGEFDRLTQEVLEEAQK